MTGFSESSEFGRETWPEVAAIVVHETLLGRAPSAADYAAWTYRFAADGTVATRVSEILKLLRVRPPRRRFDPEIGRDGRIALDAPISGG